MERLEGVFAERKISNASKVVKTIKCLRCGTINDIPENGATIRCRGCYMLIRFSNSARHVFRKYNCWACLDTGLLEFEKQFDNLIYASNCRCTCDAGKKWPSDIPTWNRVIGCPDIKFFEQKNKKPIEERKEELRGNNESWFEIEM